MKKKVFIKWVNFDDANIISVHACEKPYHNFFCLPQIAFVMWVDFISGKKY